MNQFRQLHFMLPRWRAEMEDALAPHATGGVYVNFMPDDEAQRVAQGQDQLVELRRANRIEASGGFVEKQHARLSRQRHADLQRGREYRAGRPRRLVAASRSAACRPG